MTDKYGVRFHPDADKASQFLWAEDHLKDVIHMAIDIQANIRAARVYGVPGVLDNLQMNTKRLYELTASLGVKAADLQKGFPITGGGEGA